MRILRLTREYRLLMFSSVGLVVLTCLNLMVYNRAHDRSALDLINGTSAAIGLVAAVITALIGLLIFRLSRLAYWIAAAAWASAFVLNLVLFLRTRNFAIAFYGLFFVIVWGMFTTALRKRMWASFVYSGRQWFEGRPVLILSVVARIRLSDGAIVSGSISRVDDEGTYFFFQDVPTKLQIENIELELEKSKLNLNVIPVVHTQDDQGVGLKFLFQSQDDHRHLSDFINRLRSYGYVSA
jgi:hypothetical protein